MKEDVMVKNQAERVAYHGLGCWQDEQGEDGEIEGEDQSMWIFDLGVCNSQAWTFGAFCWVSLIIKAEEETGHSRWRMEVI